MNQSHKSAVDINNDILPGWPPNGNQFGYITLASQLSPNAGASLHMYMIPIHRAATGYRVQCVNINLKHGPQNRQMSIDLIMAQRWYKNDEKKCLLRWSQNLSMVVNLRLPKYYHIHTSWKTALVSLVMHIYVTNPSISFIAPTEVWGNSARPRWVNTGSNSWQPKRHLK